MKQSFDISTQLYTYILLNTIINIHLSLQDTLSKITTLPKQQKYVAKDHSTSPDANDSAEATHQPTSADTQHGIEYSFIYYVAS